MAHFGDELDGFLKVHQTFSQTLPEANPKYNVRSTQIQMASTVYSNFANGQHAFIEAKTGVGKSNGYLVPILLGMDVNDGKPIIVSTATKVLQDQLARDIPQLLQDLGLSNIKYTILKGKSNYLCPYKYEKAYAEGRIPHFLYLQCKSSKEVEDLRIPLVQADVVRFVNADDDCLGRRCPRAENCPMLAARRKAKTANLIVTNHHVVMYDIRYPKARILPSYKYIVFDEGHSMPEVLANVYTRQVSQRAVNDLIKETRNHIEYVGHYGANYVRHLLDELEDLTHKVFSSAKPKSLIQVDGMGPDTSAPFLVDKNAYDKQSAAHMAEICESIVTDSNGDPNRLVGLFWGKSEEDSDAEGVAVAYKLTDKFTTLKQDLEFINKMHNHFAFWAEVKTPKRKTSKPYTILNYTPIDVGSLYQSKFGQKSVVITSATLGIGGRASYFQSILGFDPKQYESSFTCFDSPFDYDANVRVYIPGHIPNPNEEEFFDKACEEMEKLIRMTQGRTLVLCTSINSMKNFYERMRNRVPYTCLMQGEGSLQEVLRTFREDEHSILFGTKSMWEGIDVPGMSLASVILDKLPFPNQSNPIVKATCEYHEANFRNAFRVYSIPEAVMQFKQGVGRLIRNEKDFGIITILDARIRTATYGEYFIDALPTKNVIYTLAELEDWWKAKTSQMSKSTI